MLEQDPFAGHLFVLRGRRGSRVQPNGYVELPLGLGDPRQAARVITAAQLRTAEERVKVRSGVRSRATDGRR